MDIICSSKLTVFLKLCSRKTVRFLEKIKSMDKYPSIFSHQMKTTAYLVEWLGCYSKPEYISLDITMPENDLV